MGESPKDRTGGRAESEKAKRRGSVGDYCWRSLGVQLRSRERSLSIWKLRRSASAMPGDGGADPRELCLEPLLPPDVPWNGPRQLGDGSAGRGC